MIKDKLFLPVGVSGAVITRLLYPPALLSWLGTLQQEMLRAVGVMLSKWEMDLWESPVKFLG